MKKQGFSLIEVNMAVFVMAAGILSMAVLYPLGLRESMQAQADIKQAMFADYVLSVAVATACKEENQGKSPEDMETIIKDVVRQAVGREKAFQYESGGVYVYEFDVIKTDGGSDRLLGIMVRSLDMDLGAGSAKAKNSRLQAQPFYYAEVRY